MTYFHKLTEGEIKALGEVVPWQRVIENYSQPPWRSYHQALNPRLGCWSLTEGRIHSEDDCKGCDEYRPEGVEVHG